MTNFPVITLIWVVTVTLFLTGFLIENPVNQKSLNITEPGKKIKLQVREDIRCGKLDGLGCAEDLTGTNSFFDYRVDIKSNLTVLQTLHICGHEFRHIQLWERNTGKQDHHGEMLWNDTSLKPVTYRHCLKTINGF